MMVLGALEGTSRRWLITGVAGFIGSNLLEALLRLDQTVVGLDNFATGHRRNLSEVERSVAAERWKRFRFIEGDIRDMQACREAMAGVDVVLHQAALGSVPRSIADPITSNEVNVGGFQRGQWRGFSQHDGGSPRCVGVALHLRSVELDLW